MIGLIVCLLATLTTLQITAQKRLMETDLERRIGLMKEILVERGTTLAENLGGQAENDIAALNFSNLTEAVHDAVRDNRDLSYGIIMDAEHVAFIHTLQPDLTRERLTAAEDDFAAAQTKPVVNEYTGENIAYLEFIRPITVGIRRWGCLRLGFSLDALNQEIITSRGDIRTQIRGMILNSTITSIIFIMIGAGIVLYVSTRLSSPLIKLTESADELAGGNFAAAEHLEIHDRNEVGVLASAFIDMSKKLKDYSQNLEQKVEERTRELSEALDNLKTTQKQLVEAEKMASLGGLVAGIAHEINTPVGVGVTAASVLAGDAEDFRDLFRQQKMKKSDLEEFVETSIQSSQMILTNLERASELIQSFKQVAVDQSSEEIRTFQLREYINEIILSLGPKLKKTAHSVVIECETDIQLDSYPGVFSQIFTNLVLNALIHAFDPEAEPGTITIRATADDTDLHITFSDNGKGIEVANLSRIFDPFFTTRRGSGGSGLGLHIIYNLIVQKLGGTITCDSTVGVGTTFSIKVPLCGRSAGLGTVVADTTVT